MNARVDNMVGLNEIQAEVEGGLSVAQAEMWFLGSILLDHGKLMDARVNEAHFASNNNRLIYRAIRELEARAELVDTVSVHDHLKIQTGRDWMALLGQYANDVIGGSFFTTSQAVMIRAYQRREIVRITRELGKDFDADKAIKSLMDLEHDEHNYSFSLPEAALAAVENAEKTAKCDGIPGLPTGLVKLDELMGGFQAPDLYIIGARPAMGKTSVALNFMLNHDAPVGFFSTEQPHEQIGLRAISIRSTVSASKIRVAKFDDHEYARMAEAVTALAGKKIHIYDKSYLKITELTREARRMKYNHDIQAVYVDYIQRVHADAESRRLEVAEVAASLKSLARELHIPVIALAQVNREVDKRTDKRPRMGDLVESGAIEQEADVVMLLYRDEVYDPKTSDKGIIEVLVDKNRHGPSGRLRFIWEKETMRILNMGWNASA